VLLDIVKQWSEAVTALAGQVQLEESEDSSCLFYSVTTHFYNHGISINSGKHDNLCYLKHDKN
jgi:hypothetical protein